MAKALGVAKYFIKLAEGEDEPEYLSHLRLQKLLYYSQGWSLALRHKRLFKEKIEAWAHGPVVPKVYLDFADYTSSVIPADHFEFDKTSLTSDDCELIEAVWNAYKKLSAIRLREVTHQEPPWKEARETCRAGEKCNTEITQASMKKYFKTLMNKGDSNRRETVWRKG